MLDRLYFHYRIRIYQTSLGHAFKLSLDMGMRSYLLEDIIRNWTFQNCFGKGGYFWSHKWQNQVTMRKRRWRKSISPEDVFVTPAATEQASLIGMRGSGQPSCFRWTALEESGNWSTWVKALVSTQLLVISADTGSHWIRSISCNDRCIDAVVTEHARNTWDNRSNVFNKSLKHLQKGKTI